MDQRGKGRRRGEEALVQCLVDADLAKPLTHVRVIFDPLCCDTYSVPSSSGEGMQRLRTGTQSQMGSE
jgi:hypothetical protein